MGFLNRRTEYLEMRPSSTPLLDALATRLRVLHPGLIVQPAGRRPWTAYFIQDKFVGLARPAQAGGRAIDVALLPIDVARTVDDVQDLDDPDFAGLLAAAVDAAPTSGSSTTVGYDGSDGVGALFLALDVLATAVARSAKNRREQQAAAQAGTEAELAILWAARREAGRRASSLTIGCLGAFGIGLALLIPVTFIGALLVAAGASTWLVLAMWLVPLIAGWLVFRYVRRRYPSPPQRGIDRLAKFGVLAVVALIGGYFAFAIAGGFPPPPLTAEQVAWCLGPGSGYVDNAVRVVSIERTWTAETAAADPNFRRACSTAWDATHPR